MVTVGGLPKGTDPALQRIVDDVLARIAATSATHHPPTPGSHEDIP